MPPKRPRRRLIDDLDITRLHFVRSPALSPDEETVVFVVETVREDKKKYHTHLWRCRADGSDLRQLTFGERNDTAPVFSPDGRWLVFTAKRGDLPGLHIMPTDGGEARSLVEKDGSFGSVQFTPDGKTIVCTFRASDPPQTLDGKPKPEAAAGDKTPPKKEAPIYRHITRLWYRYDGEGFLPEDRWHVWAFDVATGKGTQLTKGKYDELCPTISPDGKWVAYVTNVRPDPDHDPMRQDLFVVSIRGGKPRRVPTPEGPVDLPSFSPDGTKIAYYGHTDPDGPWGVTPSHLWVVGVNGRPAARDVTPKYDREMYDMTIADTGEGFNAIRPHWSADGRSFTHLISDTGATLIGRVAIRDGRPTPIIRGQYHVQNVAFGRQGKRAAALVSTPTAPGEIAIIDLTKKTATPRFITRMNGDWLRSVQVSRPQEVWFPSTNKVRVQGWMLKPPGFSPRRRYPAIVQVHGGPRTQYGYSFFHEFQMLAARGYVVFYTNPRGSQGRGADWSAAIVNGWGTVDYEDVMAGADWLVKQSYIDPKRLGVTGGSYGGYMTNWIVGHTNRFRAAVTGRSVVELKSFFGTTDVGWDFNREFGGYPWQNEKGYEWMSPLTYAKNIRTPLLIIHNEFDMRCSIEQAEQLFTRLKVLRKTVEFVRFPEEPHGLSRHGRPDRRVARLRHIARWFDKYLKGR
ncbi:MAG TPA: S9 family peptidase [bacterium]|nr:S9 family peptidase [bacterium]